MPTPLEMLLIAREMAKRATTTDVPQLPPTPVSNLPRPFSPGDKLLDMNDIVASTNYGPWSWKDAQNGMERGITRREDRDSWSQPLDYRKRADAEISKGKLPNNFPTIPLNEDVVSKAIRQELFYDEPLEGWGDTPMELRLRRAPKKPIKK